MAAIEPAKAPPLYEPGGSKSTTVGRLIGDRTGLWHIGAMAKTLLLPIMLALVLSSCHSEETRDRIAAAENGARPAESKASAAATATNGAQPQ